jgi:hypothetical protein
MINSNQNEHAFDVKNALISEALVNTTFKKELLETPKAAIERFVGQGFTFPQGINFVVEDQNDENLIYFNIPRPPSDNLELTEEQLETIAGGTSPICGIYVCAFVTGACVTYIVGKML